MHDHLNFTKMAGTGNDFIVIDNFDKKFSGLEKEFFSRLCKRRWSIGADGLILMEKSKKADLRMRYFNSDGLEADMCGNAARCAANWAFLKNRVSCKNFLIETVKACLRARIGENFAVSVEMPLPADFTEPGILDENHWEEGGMIDTGVPHYVIFTSNVDNVDVARFGRKYRFHKAFSSGTNVNFVQIKDDLLFVRTYERGVEKETLSCGTGCVASAVIAYKKYGRNSPVPVQTPGGMLTVAFDSSLENILLTGEAVVVFEGRIE